jgi:hypothetical protein
MSFVNLRADIAELFIEAQGEAFQLPAHGFHIIHANRTLRTEPERRQHARAMASTRRRSLRVQLLSGFRPTIARIGRPPSAWIRVAKELGIDLGGRPS